MNRLKNLLLAVSLAIPCLAVKSHATADPVTIETKWIQKTFSISTTSVTSATFDIGGFGSAGYAVLGNKYLQNGVDGTTLGTLVAVTTNTTNVVGLAYSAFSSGANASVQIAQTVRSVPPRAIFQGGVFYSTNTTSGNSPFPGAYNSAVPLISTSSIITVPSGTPFSDTFQAETTNPIFYFTGLSGTATLFFTVDYAVPRPQ